MTEPTRPDPDALLARIQGAEADERRAKLKIFFGAAAGVGKTFAMLVEAHERRAAGVDVVVGVVETHGRRETGALLEGLQVLPRRAIEYRGATLPEFDLDAALARRPALVLLDELAHTNAPGSRHAKRWQDVEELLGAGIDVYTTLNVQHVESLIDVIAQITGVTVRETVPDSILDRADEIELVDLPPDDLLQRLKDGKVYVPQQAQRALDGFFRKGNLIALRELALRRTAQRVDAQMESYRRAEGIAEPWLVQGRLLVCLGDPGTGLSLVRAGRRMAEALKSEWIVAHVETPAELRYGPARRDRISDVIGLAEELGAQSATLSGLKVADEILAFARARNVARIVVGKPTRPRWLEQLFGSLVQTLVRNSGDLDVFVLKGEEGENAPAAFAGPEIPWRWQPWVGALVVTAASTALARMMQPYFDISNLVMIYLLGVMAVALVWGRGPAILASALGVALFDFFYVPPFLSFNVSDTQYFVTFAVMLLAALTIGTLTARMRSQTEAAREREQHASAMSRMSRELSGRRDARDLLESAAAVLADMLRGRVAFLLPDDAGRLSVAAGDAGLFGDAGHERGVAQWCFDNAQPAGLGTPTLPASRALYLPLPGTRTPLGVVGAFPDRHRPFDRRQLHLLRTFASQAAVALERAQLAEAAERARASIEAERMRSTLLSSVSHDLRTPLAVITGAASSLRDDATLPAESRRDLAASIADEAQRLNRLVGDLLDMTRLEAGAVTPRKEWHSLEELVGSALRRLESRLGTRPVVLQLAPDLPLVPLDDVLIEQVLHNLVDNALKYSPPDSAIEIGAERIANGVRLHVADRGRGVPPGEEERMFDKFVRGEPGDVGGAGLGLAISRGFVEAHGGRIRARSRPGGGSVFEFELPLEGEPPSVESEPGVTEEPRA